MNTIKLNDILRIERLDNVKIRLNLSNASWNALEHYHNNPTQMLIGHFHNSTKRKWFRENQIVIGLAQIKNNDWLLIDISRITKSYNNFWDGKTHSTVNTFYKHERLPEFEKYLGRLIVNFHKNNAYVTLSGSRLDDFLVKEILPSHLDTDIFPGYDKVNISWETMKRVLQKDTWRTVLENQKGVYLITDISNGKRYVGKASGKDMVLGRWKDYIKTGHGGNEELKKLSFDHIKKNFRYSILDIYKSSTNDQIILEREGWWKEVLLSRQELYGYNKN